MSEKEVLEFSELTEEYRIISLTLGHGVSYIHAISKSSDPSMFFTFKLPENLRDYFENHFEGSEKMRKKIVSQIQADIQYALGLRDLKTDSILFQE